MTNTVLKYFIYFLLLTFAGVILLEGALSVVFLIKDRNIQPENVKDFPYLYFLFDNRKGPYNEHGFKTNYTIDKPDSVYRIIMVGGSVVRGREPESSISAYLERNLREAFPELNIEVINAGVSAYVVEQEFILMQLILQRYQPDMIVGLDGYNDMLTFKLNRFYPSGYDLPPHHWKEFQIIRDKTFYDKWYSRFALPFKSINRAKDFLIRTNLEKKYNWHSVDSITAARHAQAYWNVIQDHYDFCRSKNIAYLNFLQPVRFYSRYAVPDNPEHRALSKIYSAMEKHYESKDFAMSLVPAFHKCKSMFTDDCHVTREGNQVLAAVMTPKIAATISQSLKKGEAAGR
jgi:hypothetical protein